MMQVAITEPLRDQVDLVRQARHRAKALQQQLNTLRQDFDTLYAPLMAAIKAAQAEAREAERILCTLALVAYHETGDKQLVPGVSIREQVKLDYDPATAFQWAVESHQQLVIEPIRLNVEAFEKLARLFPLAFVTITKVPQVLIARDV